MEAVVVGKKRQLTEAQRQALALGRQKLADRRRAEALDDARSAASSSRPPLRPGRRHGPASRSDRQQQTAILTDSDAISSALAGDDADRAGSDAAPREAPTAEQLEVLFDLGGSGEGAEGDSAAPSGAATSGGILGSLFGGGSGDSASKPATSKQEKEVDQAAGLWQQAASALLILACGALVGSDLAPDQKQANEIMLPIVRILMRHVDPVRRGSADLVDAVTAAAMLALYIQSITPALRAKQAQKRVQHERRTAVARPVPIERAPVIPTGSGPSAVAAAAGVGTADAAAERNGLHPIPIRADVGATAAGRGGEDSRPVSASDTSPLEDYLGFRL